MEIRVLRGVDVRHLISAFLYASILLLLLAVGAQTKQPPEQASYRNPILFADYSDPDVIRDGKNYYLIASTFHFFPGVPILRSEDLVHWTILGHVMTRLDIDPRYSMIGGNRYGKGVWAPSIRKHNGVFYVYFPTPTEGIYVSTAPRITGPWTKPIAVIAEPGLEDPCPFWDDDGKAYLIHSRTGAGPLILHRMSRDGKRVLDEGKVIAEDRVHLPVLEGPKLYKRGSYYYIFAPFGGVGAGSQAVLRSHTLYGPYEHRVVLAQGNTNVNGPHQGAYVETPDGKGWFIHFQQDGGHGRIVHLEPVRWHDDWPLIGKDPEDEITGWPVPSGPMPVHASPSMSRMRPQTSDEFDAPVLGPQWEWNHNPDDEHWSLQLKRGFLRLIPMPAQTLLDARNTLTQCMQDDAFEFTVRLDVSGMKSGVHAGIAMFDASPAGLEIAQSGSERRLQFFQLSDHVPGPTLSQAIIQLRVRIIGDQADYSFSTDEGKSFHAIGDPSQIHFSWWKGARPAIFAFTTESTEPAAIDVDWVHYQPLGANPQ